MRAGTASQCYQGNVTSAHGCVRVCTLCVCVHIFVCLSVCVCLCVFVYICIHVCLYVLLCLPVGEVPLCRQGPKEMAFEISASPVQEWIFSSLLSLYASHKHTALTSR